MEIRMLWSVLVASYLVYADIIRDDESNYFEGIFNLVHKGRMVRVLMSFNDVLLELCVVHCTEHLRCKTFNYHHDKKDCELTDEDFNEMNVDTTTPGWYNYGTPAKADGGWSSWSNLTECTKKCGVGTLDQWRDCDSPKPQYGGADCTGRRRRTVICNKQCKVVNVALNKMATQSSLFNNDDTWSPSRAIDGLNSTKSITTGEMNPWWEVNIGEVREIKGVHLNVYLYEYENFGLIVETKRSKDESWVLCKELGDLKEKITEFKCNEHLTNAQYLRIRSSKWTYIDIYEVMIFSYQTN